MKSCPRCNAEVDDHFDLCWNCQYSFVEDKIVDERDFRLVCPKCNFETESTNEYCPYCHIRIKGAGKGSEEKVYGSRHINCLRCKVPMNYQGNFRFHEGTRMGALGDLFELFTNRESFDLYCCPNCGKVEFFLPGFGL
jgi:hypothetical protein